MKRLLITGTRYGWDEDLLSAGLLVAYRVLEPEPSTEPVLLVHGSADGVDSQAAQIWQDLGMPTEGHPAEWDRYGKAAGPMRNAVMVNLGADLCAAFPDEKSRGTWDCVRKARAAGIIVLIMGDIRE